AVVHREQRPLPVILSGSRRISFDAVSVRQDPSTAAQDDQSNAVLCPYLANTAAGLQSAVASAAAKREAASSSAGWATRTSDRSSRLTMCARTVPAARGRRRGSTSG